MNDDDPPEENKNIVVDCRESLLNHPILLTYNHKPKNKYMVDCVQGCQDRDNKRIYGF